MKLLVTMSLLLTPDNLRQIGPIVWQRYLDETEASILASVSTPLLASAISFNVNAGMLLDHAMRRENLCRSSSPHRE